MNAFLSSVALPPFLQRFPGEGRGPVAEQKNASDALRYLHLCYWAPAFAGEAIEGGKVVNELPPPP